VLAAALYGFATGSGLADQTVARSMPAISLTGTLRTALLWLAIWLVPLTAVAMLFESTHVVSQLGLLFSKLAVVTFGGAYAVLAYVAQDAVQHYGWLAPGEMVDALGFAETTPGPLILVTEFVGFLAAYRHGSGPPLLMGSLGALVTLWATFAPCFLWIFVGAPYIEYLRGRKSLTSALSAITAVVVGVILNLAVWFALHTLFGEVNELVWNGVRLFVPVWESVDPAAIAIAVFAATALFRFKLGMIRTLGLSAAAGMLYYLTFLA
jgi:chromate transporter